MLGGEQRGAVDVARRPEGVELVDDVYGRGGCLDRYRQV